MKYKFFIFILSIIFAPKAFSQEGSEKSAQNLLYIEVAGIGGYGSFNYERVIFSKKNFVLAPRLGISSYRIKDYTSKLNPDILIPVSINGYYGKNHNVEFGVGQTLTNITHASIIDYKPIRRTNFHTNFTIGYRYQKSTGGIVFRCAYTPIIMFNEHFRNWAGISFGYSF